MSFSCSDRKQSTTSSKQPPQRPIEEPTPPCPESDPPLAPTLPPRPGTHRSPNRVPARTAAPYNGRTLLYNEIMSQNTYVMTLSRNGQVSIPADARARWDTRQVLVVDLGDRVVMRPMSEQPLQELRGKYAGRGPRSDKARQESRREEKHSQSRRG